MREAICVVQKIFMLILRIFKAAAVKEEKFYGQL